MRARAFPVSSLVLVAGLAGLTATALLAQGRTQRTEGTVKGQSRPSNAELRKRLTPEQYEVVCNEGTEPPFRNAYWNHKEPGIYVDVASGEPLFSSTDKFDSGTGWPSFTRPLEPRNLVERADLSLGHPRTGVRSSSGSHLGHVFRDGPPPTGLRYCINSAALRFVPVDRLELEGYGRFRALFPAANEEASAGGHQRNSHAEVRREVATLAGGCFWGMEEILRNVAGVLETRVGYTGGDRPSPGYEDVRLGDTGHAESIEVVFDPAVVSFERLLKQYFFRMHDPTTPNRQGNDVGSQYRSAVFYHSPEQRRVAEAAKADVEKSGTWRKELVTEIVPAGAFWPAEEYHQKYLAKNPGGYSCHFLRD